MSKEEKKQFGPENLGMNEWDFSITKRNRGLRDVKYHLGFDEKELEGKDVLDIGSGEAVLAQELEAKGVKVFPLDVYAIPRPDPRANESQLLEVRSRAVHALAEHLPYKDESFDVVLSLFAVPYYSPNEDHLIQVFKEMLRVCRPGGVIRVGPLPKPEADRKKYPYNRSKLTSEKVIETLEKFIPTEKGCTYLVEEYAQEVSSLTTPLKRVVIHKA